MRQIPRKYLQRIDMKPIPIILVSGFLGAGKTTLMRRLILSAHERGLKTCVIVNEFGLADVDGNILREGEAELLASVAGGCACCSGQDEFLWTLLDVAERSDATRPDVILVETSGLADPVTMLDAMTVARLLPLVRVGALICVVDNGRFLLVRDEVLPLLVRQLQLADVVVLNKIDQEFRLENRVVSIDELSAQLKTVAPHAQILPAQNAEIDFEIVWQRALSTQNSKREVLGETDSAHAHFQTVLCPLPHPVERAWLEECLAQLGSEVWRGKGFVRLRGEEQLHLLQLTATQSGPQWELRPFAVFALAEDEPQTGIVFIGPHLNRAELLRAFSNSALLPMI